MRPTVWHAGVLAAAVVWGLGSAVCTVILYLFVGETAFWFLAPGVNALFAAFGAARAGDALAADGRGVRLLPVAGVAEAAAILVALSNLAPVGAPGLELFPHDTLLRQTAMSTLAVALVAGVAAWVFRWSGGETDREGPSNARIVTVLFLLAAVVVVAVCAIDGALSPVPY